MKIELKHIKVSDLVESYINNDEEGVYAYNGNLNIRPKYQREFIYNEKQKQAVIDTIRKNFPLNVMYWVKNDNGFEVLDGQQRSISICDYVAGKFSFNFQFYHNLEESEKQQILDYELMVYFCEGNDKEKLDWFKTINIAGEKLTNQELRNAVYNGEWLTDAKKMFSKTGCPAYDIGKTYLKGSSIRQDYLESVLKWVSDDNIENYMAIHQHDNNAKELWLYFSNVINWVKTIFPVYRKEMKGVEWGDLYNRYKDDGFTLKDVDESIKTLMMDEDVTKKSGIYEYLLSDNEKFLNIRSFSERQRREAYERQNGICPVCGKKFEIEEMDADHIISWKDGGKTDSNNCQMLCKHDNRKKSSK